MNILCCREADSDRCNVDLGRIYAGDYPSIEAFIADSEKLESVLEQPGYVYDDEDNEQEIHHWKLSGFEIHKPTQPSRFDATVILYYSPMKPSVVTRHKVGA